MDRKTYNRILDIVERMRLHREVGYHILADELVKILTEDLQKGSK